VTQHPSLAVLAPLAGRLLPLSEVPDPVFAAEMVGPGVAVDPSGDLVTVVSPIAGTVVKAHPHAFIVLGPDGVGVLVHLGIDTVRLEGRGFELHVADGVTVAAGDPMVTWDLAVTRADGLSAVVPVVAMDQPKGSVPAPEDRTVVAGDLLYDVAG
jgi:PTS system glucose-specific IIA component